MDIHTQEEYQNKRKLCRQNIELLYNTMGVKVPQIEQYVKWLEGQLQEMQIELGICAEDDKIATVHTEPMTGWSTVKIPLPNGAVIELTITSEAGVGVYAQSSVFADSAFIGVIEGEPDKMVLSPEPRIVRGEEQPPQSLIIERFSAVDTSEMDNPFIVRYCGMIVGEHATLAEAIEGIKKGAHDWLIKEIDEARANIISLHPDGDGEA